jgi:LuxR family maltose regulon positive regulatory protein
MASEPAPQPQNPVAAQPASTGLGDVLAAKLRIPAMISAVVQREQVEKLLQKSLSRKLTLITAPSGYGKTTCLAAFIGGTAEMAARTVWLTLDEYDNAPDQFWTYIVTGVRKINPQFRLNHQALLQYGLEPARNALLNPLINRLADLSRPIYLVLDDFHAIQNPVILQNLKYLVEYQPENLHLYLLSRTPPALPLARERSQRQVLEITRAELAFTPAEANRFLLQTMKLDLSPRQVTDLHTLTEGWIAGLQLACLSLEAEAGPAALATISTLDETQMAAYFTEEVLAHLPAGLREFLLDTSVLPEFSAVLCDAVRQRQDSQEMLAQVEQANLFIAPLDDGREWFRYHALFAQALEYQLQRSHPERALELHRRASAWLSQHGQLRRAIAHALAAGDMDLAAEWVNACASQAIIQNDLEQMIYWISRISDEMLARHIQLGIYDAMAHFFLLRRELAEAKIAALEQRIQSDEPFAPTAEEKRYFLWQLHVIRLVNTRGQGLPERVSKLRQALEEAKQQDNYVYGFVLFTLSNAALISGDLEDAAQLFEHVVIYSQAHDILTGYLHALSDLARIRKYQARLEDAQQIYRQGLDFAERENVHIGAKADAQTGLMQIALERNDLTAAGAWAAAIPAFIDAMERSGMPWGPMIKAICRYVEYCLTLGDNVSAHFYFRYTAHYAGQQTDANPDLLPEFIAVQTRLWIMDGQLAQGMHQLQWRIRTLQSEQLTCLAEKIALARLFLAAQDYPAGRSLLEACAAEAAQRGMTERQMEVSILQAIAQWNSPHPAGALPAFEQAVRLAEANGYLRIFLNEGGALEPVLALALAQPETAASPAFLERLQSAFAAEKQRAAAPAAGQAGPPPAPPAEALSDREIEMLSVLAQGKTVKEAAIALSISANTARAHLRNIYRKLNAHNRKSALKRAEELKLVR